MSYFHITFATAVIMNSVGSTTRRECVKHARVALGLLMCMGAVGIRGSQFSAGASAEPLEELARAEAKWQVLQETDSPTAQMKADVDLLVVRAKTLKRLWPWQPAIPEVARVARHGKRVAPLLIELLDDDPDPVLEDRIDHGVQQQAALALCKIYRVIDQCGRVYCNRASTEENKAVKQFWRAKISE